MTIRTSSSQFWPINRLKINRSNGIPGNNLIAIKNTNDTTNESYSHWFRDKASSGNVRNLVDGNPLTFFEYEIFSVDHSDNFESSQNEFSYIVDSEIIGDAKPNSLFNWSNHSIDEPLVFDVTFFSDSASLVNSVKISPYFGFSKILKVSRVLVTSQDGSTENVLLEPIYIGSSLEAIYAKGVSRYFLDTATIRFPEKNAISITVIFEQEDYELVDILHSYWTTNYENIYIDNSPFFGSAKFNPESLSRDIYQEVLYDITQIVPMITNPTSFSRQDNLTKEISVTVKKKSDSNSSELVETYKVPIKLERQALQAKRMSIGLRDISFEYCTLGDSAEIVSLPYEFDKPVKSLMLSIESDTSILSRDSSLIESHVSVDNRKQLAQNKPKSIWL